MKIAFIEPSHRGSLLLLGSESKIIVMITLSCVESSHLRSILLCPNDSKRERKSERSHLFISSFLNPTSSSQSTLLTACLAPVQGADAEEIKKAI